MSTKNNPGPHDCFAKAAPDEPMFVLLARDPMAPELVRQWAFRNWQNAAKALQVNDAIRVAEEMERWRERDHPPERKP